MTETVYKISLETGEMLAELTPPSITDASGLPVAGVAYHGAEYVETPPPAEEDGKARIFQNGQWDYIDDNRGQTVYGGADGREAIIITTLGPKADFGTDEPAPLSAEALATELAESKEQMIDAARVEQYARQAIAFWFSDDTTGVTNAHVRVNRVDLDSMNDFGPLLEGNASSWNPETVWFASEPGYDHVPLPNETAAKRFKLAFIGHHQVFKIAFIQLMTALQTAESAEALAAIDISDAAYWPEIEDPTA